MGPERWSVKSASGQIPDGYLVVRKLSRCSQCSSESVHCSATECDFLCLHMYECDSRCFDYTNGHICKHIHRVHSLGHESSTENSQANISHADDPFFHYPEPKEAPGTCIV